MGAVSKVADLELGFAVTLMQRLCDCVEDIVAVSRPGRP
jgi:hypothetical protein